MKRFNYLRCSDGKKMPCNSLKRDLKTVPIAERADAGCCTLFVRRTPLPMLNVNQTNTVQSCVVFKVQEERESNPCGPHLYINEFPRSRQLSKDFSAATSGRTGHPSKRGWDTTCARIRRCELRVHQSERSPLGVSRASRSGRSATG